MVGIVTTNSSGDLDSNDDGNDDDDDDSDGDSNSSDSGDVSEDDNDDNGNNVYHQRRSHRTRRRIYERKQRWIATPATASGHETSTQPENRDPSLAVARTIVIRPLDGRRAQTRPEDQ